MRLLTSYWSNPLLGEVDALAVSTSRSQPRYKLPYSYRRADELAPNDRVWNAGTDEWRDLYHDQLDALGPDAVLGRLADLGGGKPVIVLCFEKDRADCHRGVLAEWLSARAGLTVPELRPGDLPARPDAPQPSLFDHDREETA